MYKKKIGIKYKLIVTLIIFGILLFSLPQALHTVNQYIYIPKIEKKFETLATTSVFDIKEFEYLFDDCIDFSDHFFEVSSKLESNKYIFCNTEPVIKNEKKYVALTFDDGPHKKYTKELLDYLKEKNIKVTFFLLGQNIKGNEELLKQMLAQNCEIGVHSYKHTLFTKITNEEIDEQINSTNELIKEATGKEASLVRPPYGSVNKRVKEHINMPIILWYVDSSDWNCRNADTIYKKVMDKVRNKDIVLMHDIFNSSVESAKLIIEDLEKQGYEFVTVSELLAINEK